MTLKPEEIEKAGIRTTALAAVSHAPESTGYALVATRETIAQALAELTSAAAVTKLAATVENLGAAAYLGQAPNIKSPEILAAALSIHTVEARHAAVLNSLLKLSPTPNGAFGAPASMATVLAAVKPFIA